MRENNQHEIIVFVALKMAFTFSTHIKISYLRVSVTDLMDTKSEIIPTPTKENMRCFRLDW